MKCFLLLLERPIKGNSGCGMVPFFCQSTSNSPIGKDSESKKVQSGMNTMARGWMEKMEVPRVHTSFGFYRPSSLRQPHRRVKIPPPSSLILHYQWRLKFTFSALTPLSKHGPCSKAIQLRQAVYSFTGQVCLEGWNRFSWRPLTFSSKPHYTSWSLFSSPRLLWQVVAGLMNKGDQGWDQWGRCSQQRFWGTSRKPQGAPDKAVQTALGRLPVEWPG